MSTTATSVASEPSRTQLRRRAIGSAWAGFAVDSYSIFLPAIALAPAIGYFQGGLEPTMVPIFAGLIFAATLLGRPVGALLFGRLADLIGRKRVGAVTIYGFSIVTFLIALLPGAEQVGAPLATTLLIGLRFIDGIFLGGEYTAATPLALEYSDPKKRGFVGGLIQSSANAGPALVAIAMAVTLVFLPITGPDVVASPYVQWGWRIPFVVGAIGAFVVAAYLRSQVQDSDVWKKEVRVNSPLREMLRGDSGRAFVQVWIMMMGFFFSINIIASVIPQLLLAIPGFVPRDLSLVQIIGAIPAIFAYLLFGWLSDRIGRKPAIAIAALLTLVVAPASVVVIGLGSVTDVPTLTLLVGIATAAVVAPMGVLPAYINERFPTSVRSSGWGVAYSTAVVIPAFYAFYQSWLTGLMPYAFTGGVLIVIGVVLVFVGLLPGPETRGIALDEVGKPRQAGQTD